MSTRAILRGIQTRLRSAAVLDDSAGTICGIQPNPGRPPANFGQLYYSVHWAGNQSNDPNPQSLDTAHTANVTITARLGYAPRDRRGRVITDAEELYDLAEAVVTAIHGNYDVLTEANKLIPGTAEYVAINGGAASANGFIEPFVFQSYGPEIEQSADWIKSSQEPSGVYSIPIRFGTARRIKYLT